MFPPDGHFAHIQTFLLQKRIAERADSLGKSFEEYLAMLFTRDTTLRVDGGIAAIWIIWVPLWALLFALAFSPQGIDLLAHMNHDIVAARYFICAVIIFCLFATCIATAMIGAWHFEHLTKFRRQLLPKFERVVVYRSAFPPILLAIGLPLAILSVSALYPLVFHPLIPLGVTVLRIIIAWMVFGAVVWVGVRLAAPCLYFVILASKTIVPAYGFFGLLLVAALPTFLTRASATEIVVVAAAALWLAILVGLVFILFVGRYENQSTSLSPWVPGFVLRHKFLTVVAMIYLVWVFVVDNYLPPAPRYMTAVDYKTTLSKDTSEKLGLSKALAGFKAQQGSQRPTMVLVTAAGGGIRAAYWSASVLAALQDRRNDFDRYVFAISAVSGGALGASTYKALTLRQSPECGSAKGFRNCTEQFLSGDFVGPNVVGAITGDLLDFWMRGHFGYYGRDSALEQAWAEQWQGVIGSKGAGFAGPFDELFVGRPTPALLLNGTSSESGNRVITSNLNLADFTPHKEKKAGKEMPAKADDSAKAEEQRDDGCLADQAIVNPAQYLKLSISSAVLTSARFPYVTPPGLLQLQPKPSEHCRNWEKIVDGGFVDNEGIVTMRDLLNGIVDDGGGKPATTLRDKAASAETFKKAYRLIVIRLSADSSPIKLAKKSVRPESDGWNQAYSFAMNERTAAGRDLVNDFKLFVTTSLGGCWFDLNAIDDDAPLGWTLSNVSRRRLNTWLDGFQREAWKDLHSDLTSKDIDTIETYAAKERLPAKLDQILHQVEGKGDLTCPL